MNKKSYLGLILVLILLIILFLGWNIPEKITSLVTKKHRDSFELKIKELSSQDIFKWLDFSKKDDLEGWKNKIFKGKTVYWIDKQENEQFLHSKSEKSASALYRTVSYNIKEFPVISWRWRPLKFPNKEGIEDPELKDDYALRLYLIFASGFFTNFRCVEYVWDESIKEGTKIVSPYSDKIMQLVIRSGPATEDWVREERNVFKDYKNLFGQEPRLKVRAIAIMSDSEGSGDSCEAHFKDIMIIKKL